MSYVLTQARRGPTQPQSVTGPSSLVIPYAPQRLVNFALNEYDQITGTFLTRVGSGAFTPVVTEQGIGLRFGAADGSTYLSAAVRMERAASSTAQISHLWSGSVPSGTFGMAVRDWSSSGGSMPVWRDGNSYNVRLGGSSLGAVNTWTSAAVKSQCVSAFDNGRFAFAVEGVVLATWLADQGVALISPWVLHRNGASAQGQECTTLLWGVFARAFPQELVQYLSKNPWAAFAPSVGLRVFLPTAASAHAVSASGSGALQNRGIAESTTLRIISCASAAAIAGTVGTTASRITAPAGVAVTRGSIETISVRSGLIAGYVAARGETSAIAVPAGIITAVATGKLAARASCATTSIRSSALTSTATARGVSESTGIRSGLAVGRILARGVVDAAAVAPGVTCASVAGRVGARGSSESTTARSAALAAAVAASGVAAASSLRDGLAAGRVAARGAVTISTGGALTPAASRTWVVRFEDRTLYVYQDNQ